jgi:hypothetical protein
MRSERQQNSSSNQKVDKRKTKELNVTSAQTLLPDNSFKRTKLPKNSTKQCANGTSAVDSALSSTRCECLDFVEAAVDSDESITTLSSVFQEHACMTPTTFAMQETEIVEEFLHQLRADCPQLMTSQTKLLNAISQEFERQTKQLV